jgi:hypothetical protein
MPTLLVTHLPGPHALALRTLLLDLGFVGTPPSTRETGLRLISKSLAGQICYVGGLRHSAYAKPHSRN